MNPEDAIYPSLKDRVVFVTGGGSGIGESIVEHFCAQGARVTFVDILEEASRALVERIRGRGHSAPRFIPCDLRDIELLRDAIALVGREDGPIRALVNNAGNDDRHRIENVTVEYWDERIQVNFRHQFFAAQAVRPQMRDSGGGAIINFGSISWMQGEADCIAYVTAKSAVNGLTRGLARELRPGEHSCQLRRAGLGDDGAPARPLGDTGGREADRRAAVPEGAGSIRRTSPAWCCGSPPTTAACAPRRTSSSTRVGVTAGKDAADEEKRSQRCSCEQEGEMKGALKTRTLLVAASVLALAFGASRRGWRRSCASFLGKAMPTRTG